MRKEDSRSGIGVAIDLGTTTIVGASVVIEGATVFGTVAGLNPQVRFGRDVLARINAARDGGVLRELCKDAVDACNGIIGGLAVSTEDIREITVAGNPAMEHLFLGISPEPLSRVPYRPAFKEARRLLAGEAGLHAGKDAGLYVFPLIGGFVGGDSVAVVLALEMLKKKGAVLAVDIGTNSEIILAADGVLYATSAAAGPAFEGGEISCGMMAQRGAIQGVGIDNDSVILDVIGGSSARGICGSGLIDAVSGLIGSGIIEPSGRIRNRAEVDTNLADRIKEAEGGNSFVLYAGPSGAVEITQTDIRALQAAKSAIRAGIEILLRKAGIAAGDIDAVYIAGAFGSKIKKQGLEAIGITDGSWREKITFVGDAALLGAALALNEDGKAEAEDIAGSVKYVSLSGSAHFEREFIKNMDFSSKTG
ncbi:MAG: ASKHA domain-containing protein [Deltaproteobacteria bacterium]